MYVIDANVWVGRFLPDDTHNQASERWLGHVIREGAPLVGPALVLPEVAGSLARRTGDSALSSLAIAILQRLPSIRLIPMGRRSAAEASGLAAQLRLRGGDGVYLAVARRLGFTLVTWDKELRERGPVVAEVRRPSELLGEA